MTFSGSGLFMCGADDGNHQIKQICSAAGYDHSKDIKKRHYNKMVESFEVGTPEQTQVIADFLGKWVKEN